MKLTIPESEIKKLTGLTGYRLFSHQRRKKAIIGLVSKIFPAGSTILDIGCASGDISVELSVVGYRVHAIDFEPLRVSQAIELNDKYGQNVRFENKSFEELIAHKAYDIVLLGEILEHFSEPEKMLNDIKRLLNPEGKVVITTPNMPNLGNRLKFGLLGIFPDNNPEHKYYFDSRRFSKVTSDAGYEIFYFRTCFTNILCRSKSITRLENLILFWFPLVFHNSGDTIFAIIVPKGV